jgi:hypothetical protein
VQQAVAAQVAPLFTSLQQALSEMSAMVSALQASHTALHDDLGRLHSSVAVRATSTTALERRIAEFELLLRQQLKGDTADETVRSTVAERRVDATARTSHAPDDDEPTLTLVDVVRHAGAVHDDALLMLDSAERSALESPFVDIERLATILDAMAGVARRR